MSPCDITLQAPGQAHFLGPIPLHVTMVADMPTYYANNGILDKALEVILIRRDAPGVGLIAKLDPRGLFLDEPPLPKPESEQDLEGFITERRQFDLLDYGFQHDGAADYFILASFARWISELHPLEITHPRHSLAHPKTERLPPLPEQVRKAIPEPPFQQGVWARSVGQEQLRVEGMMRLAVRQPLFLHEPPPPLFVTVLLVQLSLTGGISAISLGLKSNSDNNANYLGFFSIPLDALVPAPRPGPARIFVFSGDHQAKPLDVVIPDDERG